MTNQPTESLDELRANFRAVAKATNRAKMIKRIEQVERHRNGVAGEPFYAILFVDSKKRRMVATVFDEPGVVSVLQVDMLDVRCAPDKGGVTFGINSWRGDEYEPELRAAITAFEKARSEAR